MKNYYDLKFFADMYCKFEDLNLHLNDNYWYNIDQCMRDEDEPHMVTRKNIVDGLRDIKDNSINMGLSDLVQEHELWEAWGRKNIGYNKYQQELFGVVLGLIRFEPPKNTKKTSTRSGKVRWAHSEGSLLNYCGFGNGTSPNRHIRNILCDLVSSMVFDSDYNHITMRDVYNSKYPGYKNAYMNSYKITEDIFNDSVDGMNVYNYVISNMAYELIVELYRIYHSDVEAVEEVN